MTCEWHIDIKGMLYLDTADWFNGFTLKFVTRELLIDAFCILNVNETT